MQPLRVKTADAAIGRWPGILLALGIDQSFLRDKHGPCPACGGVDRYRFDDKEGRGTWFCSHCGSGDGFSLMNLVFGWGFTQAAKEVDRVLGTVRPGPVAKEQTEESKLRILRETWKASRPVTKGDPVWTYLNRRIGIDMVPSDIRYHPGMKHSSGGVYPVMLAAMRYPDGAAASLHRTYLTADGHKARVDGVKKFMPGKPLQTSCVRLGTSGLSVGIAEGIETALAASRKFLEPVWAAANAQLLECWQPPEGVKRVLIAADNDSSYAGQASAFVLARRLVRDGFEVDVRMPDKAGVDWADGV